MPAPGALAFEACGRSGAFAGTTFSWGESAALLLERWRPGAGGPTLGAAAVAAVLVCGIALAQDQAGDRGAMALVQCYACHSIESEESMVESLGPRIGNILGQPIASDPDFDYSPAMREFAERHGTWSEELLDAFLAWPDKAVPGTTMEVPGMPSESERADLIAHLRTLSE